MKYCVECGNRMEDDMLFCQRCGARSGGMQNDSRNDIEAKIEKMKKYNLALDSNLITWEYLCEDGDRAGMIAVKQDKMSENLAELIGDILSQTPEEQRDLIEREVYTFALESACKLCRESAVFFADYNGLGDVFQTAQWAASVSGKSNSVLADEMCELDYPYSTVVGLQSLYATRLKGSLDASVIAENLEYQRLTKKLAEEFNRMWTARVNRYIDFLASPSPAIFEKYAECYDTILKGLPIFVVDSLDESGWDLALNELIEV